MPGSSCWRDGSSNATGSWPPSVECPPVTTCGPTSAWAAARSRSRSVTWNAAIVEAMSKKLVADGMYFVGIDVIGDKVVEINAESPGGMQAVERLYEIDVCPHRHRSPGEPRGATADTYRCCAAGEHGRAPVEVAGAVPAHRHLRVRTEVDHLLEEEASPAAPAHARGGTVADLHGPAH